jgi:alkylhydroperoxidase family enzyme
MKHRSVCKTYWLIILCLSVGTCWGSRGDGQDKLPQAKCRLVVLDDDEAWRRLPRLEDVAERRLPVWARALAEPLPQTTAAMLELDHIYRTSDAIDPRLRAKMRWVAARANRCGYSQRYAEADLLAAGMTRADVVQLEASLDTLPEKERAAITFARKLTLEADAITDEEVAALLASFGNEQVVAMVLQMAYANFQDRLLLTLNVDVEPDGPLRPLAVRFAAPAAGLSIAADRLKPKEEKLASPPIDLGSEWPAFTFEQSVRGMEQQRARPGRVTVPEWKDVYPRLPPGLYSLDRPVRIKWSLVVMGYQPKLGPAWLKCLRMFGREANQDRVFEETLFWVITRTNRCFY